MLVSQATQDTMDAETKTVFERARLEREVIEAALRCRRSTLALKKYFDDDDGNAPPDAMLVYKLSGEDAAAREAFDSATDHLIDFESFQQQIKK